MPQTLLQLKQLAINSAKSANWQQAIELNLAIIAQCPNDLEALNRLGLAYMQSNDCQKAKKTFLSVLKVQKNNKIALKNLEKIKNNHITNGNCFSEQNFIDEPGKAKNIQLHRLAGKQALQKLNIGQKCKLVPKNRYISVETEDNSYIGAIPEDISFRLSKLLNDGNQYCCSISCCSDNTCYLYVQEVFRSEKNKHQNSFSTNKTGNVSNINDELVLEEDIPIQIVSTDDDEEEQELDKGFDDLTDEDEE